MEWLALQLQIPRWRYNLDGLYIGNLNNLDLDKIIEQLKREKKSSVLINLQFVVIANFTYRQSKINLSVLTLDKNK